MTYSSQTVVQLKALAKKNKIDLKGLTRKDEIITKIKAKLGSTSKKSSGKMAAAKKPAAAKKVVTKKKAPKKTASNTSAKKVSSKKEVAEPGYVYVVSVINWESETTDDPAFGVFSTKTDATHFVKNMHRDFKQVQGGYIGDGMRVYVTKKIIR